MLVPNSHRCWQCESVWLANFANPTHHGVSENVFFYENESGIELIRAEGRLAGKIENMIAIIDYQMGNLRSVQKGFEKVGFEATITSSPSDILKADKVVLPGVGAFRDAIAELKNRGFVEPIKQVIAEDKPFLGICLGLQLLFERSYEGGEYDGLGVIPGEVRKFELPREYKVPHMGWNQAVIKKRAPILQGLNDGSHFYFVHSFYAAPASDDIVAIEANYHEPFCAAIWNDANLFATQFHPEKSQSDGLKILKNFAELSSVAVPSQ